MQGPPSRNPASVMSTALKACSTAVCSSCAKSVHMVAEGSGKEVTDAVEFIRHVWWVLAYQAWADMCSCLGVCTARSGVHRFWFCFDWFSHAPYCPGVDAPRSALLRPCRPVPRAAPLRARVLRLCVRYRHLGCPAHAQ